MSTLKLFFVENIERDINIFKLRMACVFGSFFSSHFSVSEIFSSEEEKRDFKVAREVANDTTKNIQLLSNF